MSRSQLLIILSLASALIVSCGDESETLDAATLELTLQGQTQTVNLGQLPRLDLDGAPYARLSEVVVAAFPEVALDALQADFFDVGGVSPSTKDFCKDLIPAAGELLDRGFIQLESRNLLWQETLQYPGCMSWRDVALIALSRR